MSILVNIDGRILPEAEARIPVLDRGFLYGDSVYEVLRTFGRVPFALDEHLERLERSAELLNIVLPWDRSRIGAEIARLLRQGGPGDFYLRIIMTRGEGEIDLDPAVARDPHAVVIMKPFHPLPDETIRKGVSVLLVPSGRCPSGAVPDGSKTGNYLANIMALGQARRKGHYECVMVEGGGHVAEGSTTNIFLVRGGHIETPSLDAGILAGITRSIVIEECRRLGLVVRESRILPQELMAAEEAFLTSTIRDVLPVVRVDDTRLGDGRPGPVTGRIRETFLDHVRRRIERDAPRFEA